MKKIIALCSMLALAVIGGLGYLLLGPHSPLQQAGPASSASSASSSSAATSSASSTVSNPGQLSKRKPPETVADLIETIHYEISKNPDTVGWLSVPDTDIENSVVQSHDNLYYLRRTERGEPDVYGCYFADYECSFGARDNLSPNTVIYGHSDLKDNPDGLRFSQLFKFTDDTFARRHPTLSFSTVEEPMNWEIFAVFYADTSFAYNQVRLSEEGREALIAEARRKSIYHYDTEVTAQDKLITLSTCTVKYGERSDQRFVVMAKLLPADAALPREAALTVNENPEPPAFMGGQAGVQQASAAGEDAAGEAAAA